MVIIIQIKFLNKSQHLQQIKQLKRNLKFLFSLYIYISSLSSHTKELLDEALDSVKNVLMQTFKKNLEAGGDLKYNINLS
jgi:hypothetical protein